MYTIKKMDTVSNQVAKTMANETIRQTELLTEIRDLLKALTEITCRKVTDDTVGSYMFGDVEVPVETQDSVSNPHSNDNTPKHYNIELMAAFSNMPLLDKRTYLKDLGIKGHSKSDTEKCNAAYKQHLTTVKETI